MSKVDRTHRSFTSKTTRRVIKVASDTTDKARSGLVETEVPNPWDEQARPSGSDAAQSADFVVEVCDMRIYQHATHMTTYKNHVALYV